MRRLSMQMTSHSSAIMYVMEGVIYKLLECGRGVDQVEEHDGGSEEAFVGDKGSLPLVAIFDLDIVIAPADTEFSEQCGILEFVDDVQNERKGVGILNSMFVQIAIVLERAKTTTLLFDTEEWESLGGV